MRTNEGTPSHSMEDHEEFEPEPPVALDVLRRAAIIKFHFVYLASAPPPHLLAPVAEKWTSAERDKFAARLEAIRQRFLDELRSGGLWEDTSPSEREIFERQPDAITDRQRINTSWRAEAAHCLAWALRLVDDIPDYDTQTDPEIVIPLIPTRDLVSHSRSTALRSHSEIERARAIAELWHWRSRTRQLQQDGYVPREGQPSLDAIVRTVAPRMAAEGMLPSVIDEDFPVLGRAYRDLADEEWATARSIAMERHYALNWLCGYAPGNEWDETPTET